MISSTVSMGQLQQGIDTISHNLANMNRTGYQRRESSFADMLYQQVNNQTVPQPEGTRYTPEGIRVGTGAGLAQTAMRFEQGSIHQSGRSLDFALTQPGQFFPVERDGETYLTRDGAFYLTESAAGAWQLVTRNGEALLDADGNAMTVPGEAVDFTLQPDGTLNAQLNDGTEVAIGTLSVANVSKPQLLEAIGNNLFAIPDVDALDLAIGDVLEYEAATSESVVQGALEQSNVDMAMEMVKLMEMQRLYSMHSRSLSQSDQMMGLVNSLR
ncbi:flagellar basal-body rod protein FlgG [Geomicrobium sp. JCM 19037]|uniref:flagellar hook-basal body protein n=1 Tax=unclassified Geomicrobium TaxID=2628951 RepID=UPI00045F285E|nr:flagellar hook-basal body protein [Geomicrobium sp. JCM 19037]GAK05063.1 flagellar basal-body rod protein FlgG [Geomicrobium sp. JCM 19037]